MRTRQPARWPPGARTSEAIGYLLAHHVPAPWLAHHGLTLIRHAAGWHRPPEQTTDAAVELARSWVQQARAHAHLLGAPPDLPHLLSILADGVIRTHAAAIEVLAKSAVGEARDPRILIDFARWCGLDLPAQELTIGARNTYPVRVYARHRDDLTQARTATAKLLRHWGILTAGSLNQYLADQGHLLDTASQVTDLRRILAIGGTGNWMWPREQRHTAIVRAATRIATLARPIRLRHLPTAIARSTAPRRAPVTRQWPPPVAAVRAWANESPQWITDTDTITPVPPVPPPRRRDLQVMNAYTDLHPVLSWSQLRNALVEQGMTPRNAAATIFWSPLLRRTTHGYALL